MTDHPPTKVTMVIQDNPTRGLSGQSDFQITLSVEPDMDLSKFAPGELPDPDTLPLPIVIAMEMLHHVTGMAYETAWIRIAKGSEN